MNIKLPDNVNRIIEALQAAGCEAYAVGGCVRDSLLGRIPDDWDITTSAKPLEVKALFRRTVDTGIKHGTVTVLIGKERYEVTTYRIDGEYEDNRHPKEVTFTVNLIEDLKRRDFTINAMAYNDREGLIDEFEGMGDLKRKIIRCVGNPMERFSEDALRIMRAIRFAAQLGYEIEDETKLGMNTLVSTLSQISAERIQVELVKLITSPNPYMLKTAYEIGITKIILPELDRMMKTNQNHVHHIYSVGEHTLHSLEYVGPDKILRLSMLFHDVGKPDTETVDADGTTHFKGHASVSKKITNIILRRLKFDNETIRKVTTLVVFHDYKVDLTEKGVRHGINKVGEDLFPLLFDVKYADIMAQSEWERASKLEQLQTMKDLYKRVRERNDCVSLKTLALTGKDLIDSGMTPGKEIGEMLKALLEQVLNVPENNNKEWLLSKMKELKSK